ncbi:MAG: hypothetical protein ACAH88_05525 [Roseimicrobium sp.]
MITQKFTWVYLFPIVFGFFFGAVLTRSLREGRHEDNSGVVEREKDPVGFWFRVILVGAAYLLPLYITGKIAYQLEYYGELPQRRQQADVADISGSDVA